MFATTTPIATRVTASGLGAVQLTAAFSLGHPWPVVAATACCVQKDRCELEDLLRDRFDAHVHDAANVNSSHTALSSPESTHTVVSEATGRLRPELDPNYDPEPPLQSDRSCTLPH